MLKIKIILIILIIFFIGLLIFLNKKQYEKFEDDSIDLNNLNLDMEINLVNCNKFPSICSKKSDTIEYNPYNELRAYTIVNLSKISPRYSPVKI